MHNGVCYKLFLPARSKITLKNQIIKIKFKHPATPQLTGILYNNVLSI